jgi:alkanesulfonate monooxygenase SsuD/methylene tetrahydromethanopterin reductase-like flavin-dependent oxidoreductase (luciferase family)
MRVVVASGGLRTIVGSPEQVVGEIRELADAGIDGLGVAWVDPSEGIATFGDVLMPMLADAGLREPAGAGVGAVTS